MRTINGTEINIVDMVEAFHDKFKQPDLTCPGELPASVAALRKKLIAEEAQEMVDAIDRGEQEEMLDSLCDLLYVVVGTAIAAGMGAVLGEAFYRVHQANMAKEIVRDREDSKRDSKWDIVKPKGWKAPDLGDLV